MGIHHKKDAGYYCIVYYYWVLSLYSGITHCLSTLCYSKKRSVIFGKAITNQHKRKARIIASVAKDKGLFLNSGSNTFIQGLLWYIQRGIAQLFRASLATIFIFLSLLSVTIYIWLSLWLFIQNNKYCLVEPKHIFLGIELFVSVIVKRKVCIGL